jgi:hypothetical protein
MPAKSCRSSNEYLVHLHSAFTRPAVMVFRTPGAVALDEISKKLSKGRREAVCTPGYDLQGEQALFLCLTEVAIGMSIGIITAVPTWKFTVDTTIRQNGYPFLFASTQNKVSLMKHCLTAIDLENVNDRTTKGQAPANSDAMSFI